MPSVRIMNGPNQNQVHRLVGGEHVGRDPGNAIQVFAPGVSRRHFQFRGEGGRFYVEDLGSSNGTYVNNLRISRHLLQDGDTITVGGINLRYVHNDDPRLGSSSDEIQLGAFGAHPGGTPFPGMHLPAASPVTPTSRVPDKGSSVVVVQEDEEEEPAEDFALDASIVFDPKQILQATDDEDKLVALQKRLSIMFEISQALGEIQSLEAMCDKIMDELFAVFPQADRGFVLTGSRVEELHPVVVRDRNASGKAEVQISRTIARKVLTERQAILSQNAMEDDRFSGGMSILNFRILSLAVVPMLFRDEVFGLVQLDTQDRARRFTPDDLNLMAGIAAQAATFIKNLKLFEAAQEQMRARQNLERYFSPAVATKVASGEIDLKLGGDLKSGTVFFSDVIGFTSMSERMTAPDVVARINRYMKHMVDIVFKYNGSVDKFIGDCIMAVWGVPLPLPDEALAAVTAAVEMQNALYLFNCELLAEGANPMHMGIGLNSGAFVAGNMGSERRMEFTVIGDNVNLAQRLESKAGRGMVLTSEPTFEKCSGRVVACKLQPVSLKGKASQVVTFCIRGVEQPSSSGKVYMTSLPCAVEAWSPDCQRCLLVKVKTAEDHEEALGLILFPTPPAGDVVKLEFYAPEMPKFTVDFQVQGQVPIQAPQGCCMKGVFRLKGTPLETLLRDKVYESDKSPDDMPRAQTPF